MTVWLTCLAGALSASPPLGAQPIPPAYLHAAQIARIPAEMLYAVAVQESGLPLHHRLIPWPWTLNIAGAAERYRNRRHACNALRRALLHVPATRVDAGLGQVNVGFHGDRVSEPCGLLDPYLNLAITATLLRESRRPGEDWLTAAGRYHRPAGGPAAAQYRRSVQAHWDRIARSDRITWTDDDHP